MHLLRSLKRHRNTTPYTSSPEQPLLSASSSAGEAGQDVEEKRLRCIEEDLRRLLAASILQRETSLETAFASFAKMCKSQAKKKKNGRGMLALVKGAINHFMVLQRAWSLARRMFGRPTVKPMLMAEGEEGDSAPKQRMIKGKEREEGHDSDSDYDPAKKSGPGKVMEEGTFGRCGEEAERIGWSEDAVEWCGVRYARGEMPPFNTSGLDQMAYNPNHALWLATAAALSYRSPAQIRHVVTRIWLWEGMKFFHDAATDTQGFGMYGKECIVICFRGTESAKDWGTNSKAAKIAPFPNFPDVKVHRGFNLALMSIWRQIVAFINKARSTNPGLPLYITGHSLGGALANLCLAYFTFPSPIPLPSRAAKGKQMEKTFADVDSGGGSIDTRKESVPLVNGVYTFGQPKVGNRRFASELRARTAGGTPFFRLTNNNDIIPFFPLRSSYAHCGTRIFHSQGHILLGEGYSPFARHFCRETSSRRMAKRWQQGMRDHLVKSYVSFLQAHYRLNEAILLPSKRKDVSLLHFHDMERAKQLRDELRNLRDFDTAMKRLRQMTLCELIDLRAVTLTARRIKGENRALGTTWLRNNIWGLMQFSEQQEASMSKETT